MNPTQEPKYMIVDEHGNELPDARIANRATGQTIPDEEPILIVRGKDRHAPGFIAGYVDRCENVDHQHAVRARLGVFDQFQADHPERVKEPD